MATVTFEPGFYPDVPEQDYLSGDFGPPEGSLSASGIKTLLKAPALFRHEQQHPREETDQMRFGTVVHELLLGAGPGYVVVPPTSAKKADQAAHKAAKLEAIEAGKAYLSEDDFARAEAAVAAVRADPTAARLLDADYDAELTAFARDEVTGVWRRCRYDVMRKDNLAIDVKTARDASPAGFAKACHNLGYHISAAYYDGIAESLGRPLTDYAFLVVESHAPHLVGVYRLDEDSLALGRQRTLEGLQRYRDCTETDLWPGYLMPDDHTISLPAYAFKESA